MNEESESGGGWSAGGWFAVLGVLLLFVGLITYFYEELRGGSWMYSYWWLGILLMVLGVGLIIAEAFLHFRTPKKESPSNPNLTSCFMHVHNEKLRRLTHSICCWRVYASSVSV